MREIDRRRTPVERAMAVLDMQYVVILAAYRRLALRHRGASDAELDALYVEETYGGQVDQRLLEKACAIIRSRDSDAAANLQGNP